MKSFIIFFFSFFSFVSWALTEENFLKLLDEPGPDILGQKLQTTLEQFQGASLQRQYDPVVQIKGRILTTQEKPLMSAAPLFSPEKSIETSLQQKFPFGVSGQVLVGQQHKEFTQMGKKNERGIFYLGVGASIDLWKDFLGTLSQAEIQQKHLQIQLQQLKEKILATNLKMRARKLFWDLWLTQESLKVVEELIKQAKELESFFRKRVSSQISDRGELASMSALVSGRLAQQYYLQYQRNQQIAFLKKLVPQLARELEITIETVFDSKEQSLRNCFEKIQQQKTEIPWHASYLPEVEKLVTQIREQETLQSHSLNKMDIKLSAMSYMKGVEESVSDSMKKGFGTNHLAHEVSLGIVIPLGESSVTQMEIKKAVDKLKEHLELEGPRLQSLTTHEQMLRSIPILVEVMATQEVRGGHLKIRVEELKKQFNQARVDLNAVISDENRLMENRLDTLKAKHLVAQSLMEYLLVFPKLNCLFNQVK